MKKNVFGRKFSRDTNERKALFRNLISSLVINDRIKTTEPKAKAIKRDVDKFITKVKKNGELARRLLVPVLNSQAVEKLINDVAPRFKNRNGGYTRIIRIGKRFGDDAMEVIMEFTEKGSALTSPRQLEASSDASTPAVRSKRNLGARSPKATLMKKSSRAKAPRAKKTKKK